MKRKVPQSLIPPLEEPGIQELMTLACPPEFPSVPDDASHGATTDGAPEFPSVPDDASHGAAADGAPEGGSGAFIRRPSELIDAGFYDSRDAKTLRLLARRFRIGISPTMRRIMGSPDGSPPDGSPPDGSPPDGSPPDGSPPDGSPPDGSPPDPIARQFIPSAAELEFSSKERCDPIGDQRHSPVPGIVHRYPDRVLLMPTLLCAVYCRFCFRRESVGKGMLSPRALEVALRYIRDTQAIREVILTGGDPLVLAPRRISSITSSLEAIPHVKVLRLHTRAPLVTPECIGADLLAALEGRLSVVVVLHVNHVRELTPEGLRACRRLMAAGIPLVSQSVLLRGVNDTVEALETLLRTLYEHGVRPYYLHQLDRARGTEHFRVPIREGQALMRALRGRLSGLAQPTYVLDVPGGYGKVPIGPSYLEEDGDGYRVRDPSDRVHGYGD